MLLAHALISIRTGDTQGGPRMRSCIPNTSYNTDANSSTHLHQCEEKYRDPDMARQDRLRSPLLADRQLRRG
ncbi:hypothetical protein MGG_14632 [Pyricularia oryzae 70-15]|uniref:Uncharacterized protein n=3 Tax=Pyricularia oryzae TaxID=318829 RepID=G4NBX4_PYRO7|nr:uncharacterized protein MGG_14632 [Pyricularia oryzae 70-15]EHA48176.1 hypothetical protein MGG_14632 [Pyricularia oryzae 70-15]ELQ40774.1 hypothetical protein OOU_Y34scaffold00359g1 [Pyricularia oryzae Y34]